MRKRFIALGLVLVMCFVDAFIGGPFNLVDARENMLGFDSSRQLTKQELSVMENYTPAFPNKVTREYLISLCDEVSAKQVGDRTYITYSSQDIQNYLYDFGSELELGATAEHFYISYLTTLGDYVILAYSNEGLSEKGVHNMEQDVYYYVSGRDAYSFESYHYAMSEETEHLIDEYLENNDIEGLSAVEGIQVIFDSEGNVIIQEELPPMVATSSEMGSRGLNQPTTETEVVNSLKAAFPMYTHSLKHTASAYCDALGRNISIRVYETRNNYRKTTADYRPFLAGAALTAVSLYLGVTPGIAEYILAALSIGVSATDTILASVTLYRQAHFDYTFSRVGYAYDYTVYNDYVRVIEYTDTGVFAGGYDNEDVFRWIYDEYPSSHDVSYSTVVNRTIYNYNSDVFAHNSCTMYFPDWV